MTPTAFGALSVAPVSGRDRGIIWACVLAIVTMAWAYLFYLDHQMSSSMDHARDMAAMGMSMDRTWTASDVAFTFAMWAVMMVGMMAASAAPVLLLFAAAHARRGSRGVPWFVLAFGLGYIVVWVGFSALAALGQWVLHDAGMLSPAMRASSAAVSGVILCVAGVYQLTSLKRACLTQCQSPIGFFMTGWRGGMRGAITMGMRHGEYCLGCCWALMCVLFVVGIMNLLWVAALALFVLVEKVAFPGVLIARAGGIALIAAGLWQFFA